MRIGIIYCCYGNPEYIDDCLKPWVEAKKTNDILIAAVHGQFTEYHDLGLSDNDEISAQRLRDLGNKLDFLYIQNSPIYSRPPIYQTEAEIRDKGLQWLLKQKCDYIIMLDNDEEYSVQEINNLIEYIQKDQFISVYNIEFKNLTFSDQTYTKGFAPQRIWKVDIGEYRLNSVAYDNDCNYINKTNIGIYTISDKQLSHKKIPLTLVNPLHKTWNNLERSKQKILYAEKRWNPPNGNGCSFKIDKDGNSISWNLDYYKRINQSIPEIFYIGENNK